MGVSYIHCRRNGWDMSISKVFVTHWPMGDSPASEPFVSGCWSVSDCCMNGGSAPNYFFKKRELKI